MRAANSNKNGLYFCSDAEVHFDANPIGRRRSTHFPDGLCDRTHCDNTAASPSWHPSNVTTKGEPSYLGAWRTGRDTKAAFKSRNALVCSSFHRSSNLKSRSVHRYVFLVYGCVRGASFTKL